MRSKTKGYMLLVAAVFLAAALPLPGQGKKEYLSATEADKIRDADTSSQRIKLFLSFAADRIKKLQYELSHPATADRRRVEQLNSLLNAYAGCVDDAADLIGLGREKQQDIRDAVKEMRAKAKEFLAYLEPLASNGPELASYKSTLDDAIEATRDALKDAEKAAKEIAPPVRRKP